MSYICCHVDYGEHNRLTNPALNNLSTNVDKMTYSLVLTQLRLIASYYKLMSSRSLFLLILLV